MCTEFEDELPLHYLDMLSEPLENFSYINFDDLGLQSWRDKPMKKWTSAEVLDFIKNETLLELNFLVDVERFGSISGYIFQTLSKEYCQILTHSLEIGEFIYEAKENYIKNDMDKEDSNSNIKVNTQEELICDRFSNATPKKVGRPKSAFKKNKKNDEKKSKKLWEFLLHLLSDEKTCPDLIRWENFEEGTFKFVKSDVVARLWGSRNKNENMTYEKFTRAIRYHYKSRILLPVPGKRLVYRFGPHAKGWNSTLPCY